MTHDGFCLALCGVGLLWLLCLLLLLCVCSLFLCVGALLGVWDNMVVLVDHSCGFCVGVAGCVLVVLHGIFVVGVLCENCIVDASNLYSLIVLGVLFVTCVLFVKGTRWMPWHYEPMKDV